MLQQLKISNYTLIDEISIPLSSGLTTITGQTGAGKSIMLGALSLVLGKRAGSDLLFDADKKCVIEAEFSDASKEAKLFLEQQDFDVSDNIILRRELLPSGKSRSFINDTPANLKQLAELGSMIIDIHAQHENLKLSDVSFRTFVLDAYAGNLEKLGAYQETYNEVHVLRKRLNDFQQEVSEKKKEQDYLQFLFEELETANVQEGELEEKEEQLKTKEHAEEIKSTLLNVQGALSSESSGLSEMAHNAERMLASIASYSNGLEQLAERIKSVRIELQDIFEEASRMESEVVVDASETEILQERIDVINGLLRKHQADSADELNKIQLELETQLEAITGADEREKLLQDELEHAEQILKDKAEALSASRKSCLSKFEQDLLSNLKEMGMPQSRFTVDLRPMEDCGKLGKEQIDFLFTANKGSSLKKVAESASGGELSRILLAIKAIISERTKLPSIVFDEIDTGVSGEVANKMGDLMKSISGKIQVIAITHLPQIAAKGKHHFSVFKDHKSEKTLTKIELLEADSRVIELAKMLSGDKLSTVAKENARMLLKN